MYLKPMLGSTGYEGIKLVMHASQVTSDIAKNIKVNIKIM